MKAVVSLDEFRKNLSDIVAQVMYGDQTVTVQKHRRNSIVLISQSEYEALKDPRKRFTEEEWKKKFLVIDKIRDRIPVHDQKKLEMEISRAVREVRAEKKQNGHKT